MAVKNLPMWLRNGALAVKFKKTAEAVITKFAARELDPAI